jgi:serine O-acetyltransferase
MNLIQQIHEDWLVHGRDWSLPGFRAVAVYRFGVWRMQFENPMVRLPLSFVYRRLYRKMRNSYGIELPHSAKIGRRLRIEHQSDIVVHGECEIGDDCVLRQGVTLGCRYLDRPLEAPMLGDRVNVGAGAKILGGVRIGDGANIGANSVVLKDVGRGETAVGIPAKILATAVARPRTSTELTKI